MYSREEIDRIKTYLKTEGHADQWTEPTVILVSTLLFYFAVVYLIYLSTHMNTLVPLTILLGLLTLRIFILFHDMCHRSFFPTDERATHTKGFNYWIASIIDVFTAYPAEQWSDVHSHHHRVLGNLNETDGTRSVLTSSQYDELPEYQKTLYKIFRYPPVFFLLAPLYIYWINRAITGRWVYLLKYAAFLYALYYVGSTKLLIAFLAAQYIAGTIGLILFHLQHQVNDGFWKAFDQEDTWMRANAELSGSTVQTIPCFLEYFTCGIEYHNIHHMDPGVPGYKLKRIYYDLVGKGWLSENTKIGYGKMWDGLWNVFYDEKTEKYVNTFP